MNNVVLIAPRFQCAGFGHSTRLHGRSIVNRVLGARTIHSTNRRTLLAPFDSWTRARQTAWSRYQIPPQNGSKCSRKCFSGGTTPQARQRHLPKAATQTNVKERAQSRLGKNLTWEDYDPEGGLPLPSGDASRSKIIETFGHGMSIEAGNWILRSVNYRRESGSLIDLGIDFPEETQISKEMAFKALTYLREIQPDFDENEAGAAWADMEAQKLEAKYIERSEAVGLYKRIPEEESERKVPDVYGDGSVLVAVRKAGEARYREEQRKKEELEKEREEASMREYGLKPDDKTTSPDSETTNAGRSSDGPNAMRRSETSSQQDVVLQQPTQKAWLQPVERKPWVKYYEEQATLVKENIVPQMSFLRRTGPSALVVLATLAFCVYLHENYTPPSRSARLLPDLPPALATISAIVATNFVIAIAFRMPPLWRTMNKWFLSVPALPVPTAMLTSMFTHQSFAHLSINMVLLWAFGRYLHEDVGRGTFLAIYLGSGASAGFASLALKVYRQQWLTYVCGSSTAVYGVIAATCLLRSESQVQMLGYDVPMSGLVLLGAFTAMELYGAFRSPLRATVDFTGHFGGLATGVIAALLIRREAAARQMSWVKASEPVEVAADEGEGR